jgi:hypothetical protein
MSTETILCIVEIVLVIGYMIHAANRDTRR